MFLLVFAFLGWSILLNTRQLALAIQAPEAVQSTVRIRLFLHFVAMICFAASVFFGLLWPGFHLEMKMNETNWSVFFFLGFGVLSVGIFGERLYRTWTGAHPLRGIAFGMVVWAALGGLYMVGATLDHFWFFSSKDAGVGWAEGIGATDVKCNQILLVRIETDDAIYRCPNMVTYGYILGTPFAPWPDYHQGRSAELKSAIDHLRLSAQHLQNPD
ncbi:MAG: hypothetical protein F8N36_14375 [Desulfovibrio sp.]|uniref:hypothetical protein n=1 Tax=Desulfovibrio sp. TaxID=885 RepID=UPI00135DF218|nr:hypothetical protein [Desulfovibrio sp.]MTJ94024.1 hypothetical protein [Desulfovibrio sp.]